MPLFPAFIDLSRKNVLVVGGGKVATRKVQSLLKFTRRITVVAPKVTREMKRIVKENGLRLKRRRFLRSDLKDKFMVVVAVDDLALQKEIYQLCEKKGILCNSVDSPELCNFIFPSLIVKGDLVVGISTSGKVPALSKRVRELIESCLPEDIDRLLELLERERSSLDRGEERQRRIKELVEKLLPID